MEKPLIKEMITHLKIATSVNLPIASYDAAKF
jgi:hypothetical protein